MENIIYNERKKRIEEFFNDKNYKPMKYKEIANILQVPKEDRADFKKILSDLQVEGKIIVDNKGRYKLGSEDLIKGTFVGNQKGFGFVVVEGEDEDIFIGADNIAGAVNKDIVLVKLLPLFEQTGRRKEGKIVSIVERGNDENR